MLRTHGTVQGLKDLKDINDMSKQYKRPSMLEGLAQAKDALAGIQETQRVTATGVAGTARVLGVSDTGATLNDHPVCEVQLEVTVPGQGPYATTIKQSIPRMQAPMLQPGRDARRQGRSGRRRHRRPRLAVAGRAGDGPLGAGDADQRRRPPRRTRSPGSNGSRR